MFRFFRLSPSDWQAARLEAFSQGRGLQAFLSEQEGGTAARSGLSQATKSHPSPSDSPWDPLCEC